MATTTTQPHRCTEVCVCPIHATPLWYAPAHDEHACQNADCRYAHGIPEDQLSWYLDRPRARS